MAVPETFPPHGADGRDQVAERRPRIGDEPLSAEEATLALSLLERLPVVKLGHEVGDLLHLLQGGEHLEARAREEAGQPLHRGQRLSCRSHSFQRASAGFLKGRSAHEIAHPEGAMRSCPSISWQNMVGAGTIVTQRLGRPGSDEH